MNNLDWQQKSAAWKADGRCGQCGDIQAPGRKLCPKHLEYAAKQKKTPQARADARAKHAARIAAGQCVRCGARASEGVTLCQYHRGQVAISAARRKAQRREELGPLSRPQFECRWRPVRKLKTATGGVILVRSSWLVGVP